MKRVLLSVGTLACVVAVASAAMAQGAPLPPPPQAAGIGAPLPAPPEVMASYPPAELSRIVSPIALYPDPLLGQILTAATFSPEIVPAARWADQHHYVPPSRLPAAIAADQLPWQPSVQALLPFPQVLGMMASDMPWTEELGAAFLASSDQVMDAVQRQRQLAWRYGYLRSNPQVVVRYGPYIEVVPVNPAYVVVPYYNPGVVFVAPRPGIAVVGAIRFGYGVNIGAAFAPWGWGTTRFQWGQRVLVVNDAPWHRTWDTRTVYVHPYIAVPRYHTETVIRIEERHEIHERSDREREAERDGRRYTEEHHDHDHRDDHRRP